MRPASGCVICRFGSTAWSPGSDPQSVREYNQGASSCQENPNKSKKMQGKVLAFPWIPLAESGLFNGLRRIQIKISSPTELAWGVVGTGRIPDTHADPPDHRGRNFSLPHIIATVFV